MADKTDPALGINSWLEDELYQEYLHNHAAVDESWKKVFDQDGGATPVRKPEPPAIRRAPEETAAAPAGEWQPIRGAAARIAENMQASLAVPVATSQRTIPVKVVDENRTIINQHLALVGKNKVSYTHLIGWAVVKALGAHPNLNNAYAERDGQPFRRVRPEINFGVAIDVAGKDGARSLLVPNIKNAGALDFQQFVAAFDDLVARARTGKLTLEDFQGGTISLTNPGTVGTVGSIPRLMAGQGAIIATGAIDYPAEYHGAAPDTRAML
ncbi:MAG TPA: 2-oxo acid dehydrogenase subunit E2, partial [Bryobacteraceae bacterium]|nr:2-oxo acid dehydrogenase subunit E2 [Bryobacteraceae bacterium]